MMVTIRTAFLGLVFLCVYMRGALFAQELSELKINDTLPETIVKDLVLNPEEQLNTSNLYKEGGLLINFWATWCLPCIKEMALLADQVNKNEGKLNVLSVTYEPKAVVERFLERHRNLKNSNLKIVSDDKYFSGLFFHQALPHNIWIDNSGVVRAITSGEEINEANIKGFLDQRMISMRTKKEEPFDFNKPLHVPDSALEFRSIFKRHLEGVEMSGSVISPNRRGFPTMKRFFGFNRLIINLFWLAYQMPGGAANEYLLEVNTVDSSRFYWPKRNVVNGSCLGMSEAAWQRQNTYSYELITPHPVDDSIFLSHVIKDLELNLNVVTKREKRKRQCVLVMYDENSRRLPQTKDDGNFFLGIKNNKLVIKNVPIDFLLNWVVNQSYLKSRKEPYVNLTGLNYNISMIIDLEDHSEGIYNYRFWERVLQDKLGLIFSLKEYDYPILVINDLGKTTNP